MCGAHAAVLLVAAAAAAVMHCDAAVTCRDARGNPVDWFIVYKLPVISSSRSPQVKAGYAHMYMDVNNANFRLSNVWLNDTNHAIAYTLQQIYDNHGSENFAYLLYNDALPDSKQTSSSYGHTKGDIAFDATSGFWLVHSTPRFPRKASLAYNWPDNAKRNGQSFLCVTYGYDQFEKIGKQLMYNYPGIYDSNLPPGLVEMTPSIVSAVGKKHETKPPCNNAVSLKSMGGQTFVSFAKCSKYGKDIYSDWLAPYFKSDLYAETWRNGVGIMDSYCGPSFKVRNILELNLVAGDVFKQTKDHSKWAVTSPMLNWICIGDINRQLGQLKRGGGTVCFKNNDVHSSFYDAINSYQKCP